MAIIINSHETDIVECTCEGCSSWLDHWMLHTGISPLFCRACITKTGLSGIHVRKPSSTEQYIVPLCHTCAQKEGEMDIWSYEELATTICFPNSKNKLNKRSNPNPL